MTTCTPDVIRSFLLKLYADPISAQNLEHSQISDNFDLLIEGIIDSMGVLEMINRIEEEFDITIDLEGLDTEEITVLGPLCRYIASMAKPKSLSI